MFKFLSQTYVNRVLEILHLSSLCTRIIIFYTHSNAATGIVNDDDDDDNISPTLTLQVVLQHPQVLRLAPSEFDSRPSAREEFP